MDWFVRHLTACLHNLTVGAGIALAGFCIIYSIEHLTGERTTQYRTRNFWNDLAYWFYYSSNLHDFLINLALFSLLWNRLSFLNLHLERSLDPVTLYIVYWVVIDFEGYWIHRLLHANRFLWPFHMLHHSQEVLTFATASRLHPVENIVYFTLKFLSLVMFGGPPQIWLPLNFVLRSVPDLFQHSEIDWKMGPLHRILVSPTFHSFHHSLRPEHFDKNFGISLSIWDFLFGTSVEEEQRERVYGLQGVRWKTFPEQLLGPFHILLQTCSEHRRALAVTSVSDTEDAVAAEKQVLLSTTDSVTVNDV